MRRSSPLGTRIALGACWSSALRRAWSKRAASASPSTFAPIASKRVTPLSQERASPRGCRAGVARKGRGGQLRPPHAQALVAQAQRARGIAPRQGVEAEFAHRGKQRRHAVLRSRGGAVAFEHDDVEAALLPGFDGAGVAVPAHHALAHEGGGEVAFEHVRIDRRGKPDRLSRASKRRSTMTSQASPISALSSPRCAPRPLASV